MGHSSADQKLGLKAGDWVVVRPASEILATLDKNACFEALPLMPQMLRYCGKRLQVRKRAHKLCDTAFSTGARQMTDAVFLEDIRCDGQTFGGCELECTIIWKEAWLKRASEAVSSSDASSEKLEALAMAATRRPAQDNSSGEPRYVCQATQLPFATKRLSWLSPGQYIEDYKSGNATLGQISSRLAFAFYAEAVASGIGLGSALRWLYNTVQSARGGDPYPVRSGCIPLGDPTPTVTLDLKIGELVRVKSSDAILETLDENLINRGMGFHAEMMPFCGKTFRVKQRVQTIVNEKTGQIKHLKNSCLVLDGADCHGRYTRPLNCPRACPPYWREIWLERVESESKAAEPQAGDSRTA